MQCYVYKSVKKIDYFVYLPEKINEEIHEFIPKSLCDLLGDLQFVVDFDFHPNRFLANAEARDVIHAISAQGYYLQFPNESAEKALEALN